MFFFPVESINVIELDGANRDQEMSQPGKTPFSMEKIWKWSANEEPDRDF